MTKSSSSLIAHLDLKGVQYRSEYYLEYFENLKGLGFDAVLVEYEDMFPYQSVQVACQPGEGWSIDFFEQFLNLAAQANVEVIPLQQCLGHLEYAFRQPEYRCFSVPHGELRDLNAADPQAREWLKGLLREMLEAHPKSRFIHLGMDEARGFAAYAEASGWEPLSLFLEYLEELCAVCESFGVKPLIWSDMLEDHIAPESISRLRSLRDRVILVPWNYAAGIKPESIVRFSGFRCSRRWFEEPQGAPLNASPIYNKLLFFEDWAPEIKELVRDFQVSPYLFEPLFQAAVWKRLGFTVWGGAGGSITQDRSVLPYYNWRSANIRLWKQVVHRYRLEGLIITEWRRSNSCSVPNVMPDVVWPVLAKAASAGESASTFFPGVNRVDDLICKIGKCREGWDIEEALIREMEVCEPSKHKHEWRSILLMLQLWQIHKGIAHQEEQVGCYAGLGRLSEAGWRGHRDSISQLKEQLGALARQVREHMEKRYQGPALEEWFFKVFATPLETLGRLEVSVEQSVTLFHQREADFCQ